MPGFKSKTMIEFNLKFKEFFPGAMKIIVADTVLEGYKFWSKKIGDPLTDFIEQEEKTMSLGVANQVYANGRCYHSIIIRSDCELTVLIHETLHMSIDILNHYNIYFDREHHELLCRTQEEILNKLLPALKKRNIELK